MVGRDPAARFVRVNLCHCRSRFSETLVLLVTSCGLGCLGLCVYEHEKVSSSEKGSFCSEFHMVLRQVETEQKKKKCEREDQMGTFKPIFPSWSSHSPAPFILSPSSASDCQLTGSISGNRRLTKKNKTLKKGEGAAGVGLMVFYRNLALAGSPPTEGKERVQGGQPFVFKLPRKYRVNISNYY